MEANEIFEKLELKPGSINVIFVDSTKVDFDQLLSQWSALPKLDRAEVMIIPCLGNPRAATVSIESIQDIEQWLRVIKSTPELTWQPDFSEVK